MKKQKIKIRNIFSNRISVPIEIVELENNSYHLIVKVDIAGIQGEMIIDTGASVSVMDQKLFSEKFNDQKIIQKLQSGSVTGQIENVELFKAEYLKIGGRKIKKVPLILIDLKYVNEMYDIHLKRKIIGLLGCDFFVRYRAIIDYSAKKMTLNIGAKCNSRDENF